MRGLIHIYCGDGKGKTTAAAGLAVRAAGAGRKVLFVQFFKDGTSSEIEPLRRLGIEVRVITENLGFIWNMDDEELARAKRAYTDLLLNAEKEAADGYGLLVLDEIISAVNCGIVPERELLDFLVCRPENLEIVLTGRNPSPALSDAADYITEMRKIRHPYDEGVMGRKGIEY